jgi:uncharacterized membrane protein
MAMLPYNTQRSLVSDDTLATVVYLLYFIGYFTAFSALVGVIVAYLRENEADPMLRSHYQFQIQTFWISLVYLGIGIPLCLVLIGFPILGWWLVWTAIRNIKGSRRLSEHRPIANPQSWLFG